MATINTRDDKVHPVWVPTGGKPWRLAWVSSGDRVRRPEQEDGTCRAFKFGSAEDALDFAESNGLEILMPPNEDTG